MLLISHIPINNILFTEYLQFLVDFDFQVAASGESQYDDAFTIQRVEKCQVDEFNYVAGMVPFLLNLVKDVRKR